MAAQIEGFICLPKFHKDCLDNAANQQGPIHAPGCSLPRAKVIFFEKKYVLPVIYSLHVKMWVSLLT